MELLAVFGAVTFYQQCRGHIEQLASGEWVVTLCIRGRAVLCWAERGEFQV